MMRDLLRRILENFNEYVDDGSTELENATRTCIYMAINKCDESPWRSMESAPKTEPILAVVDGDVRVVRYGKTSHVPLYGWCIADMGPEECDLCDPTYWMPLPAAPEVGK